MIEKQTEREEMFLWKQYDIALMAFKIDIYYLLKSKPEENSRGQIC
jgi:hypothetical protein